MKKLLWLIPLILSVVVVSSSLMYVRSISASKSQPPAVRMFSGAYSLATFLPNKPTTVLKIPFTVSSTAQLEVTSDNIAYVNAPGTQIICGINLDGNILLRQENNSGVNGVNLTAADGIVASGSHTLTISCTTNMAILGAGSLSGIIFTGL